MRVQAAALCCIAAKAKSHETTACVSQGGPVTDVEQEEMYSIIKNAQRDARLNGIRCKVEIGTMTYVDFLEEFDEVRGRPRQSYL